MCFLSAQECLNRILVSICRLKHLHWKYEPPTSIWWLPIANCLYSCGTQRYLEFSLISSDDCSGFHPVAPLANPLPGLHHAYVFLLKPLPGIYRSVVANKANYYTFTPSREKTAIYRKQPLLIFGGLCFPFNNSFTVIFLQLSGGNLPDIISCSICISWLLGHCLHFSNCLNQYHLNHFVLYYFVICKVPCAEMWNNDFVSDFLEGFLQQ